MCMGTGATAAAKECVVHTKNTAFFPLDIQYDDQDEPPKSLARSQSNAYFWVNVACAKKNFIHVGMSGMQPLFVS